MSLTAIAMNAGITSSALEDLLNGQVGAGVSGRLGVPSRSLQEFINGGTSVGLAALIGCTSSSLQELRNVIGDEGAIGFLIGVCIRSSDGHS